MVVELEFSVDEEKENHLFVSSVLHVFALFFLSHCLALMLRCTNLFALFSPANTYILTVHAHKERKKTKHASTVAADDVFCGTVAFHAAT